MNMNSINNCIPGSQMRLAQRTLEVQYGWSIGFDSVWMVGYVGTKGQDTSGGTYNRPITT